MDIHDVADEDDPSRLWQVLRDAKAAGDHRLVRAVEQRMRELAQEHRYRHLSDAELRRQIVALMGSREAEDMLAHSPGGAGQGGGGGFDAAHVSQLNSAIRANQRVGIETTLGALLDEWRRRGLSG